MNYKQSCLVGDNPISPFFKVRIMEVKIFDMSANEICDSRQGKEIQDKIDLAVEFIRMNCGGDGDKYDGVSILNLSTAMIIAAAGLVEQIMQKSPELRKFCVSWFEINKINFTSFWELIEKTYGEKNETDSP
jgi:hypothetical protein